MPIARNSSMRCNDAVTSRWMRRSTWYGPRCTRTSSREQRLSLIAAAALLTLAAGILIGLYAWLAPRRVTSPKITRDGAPLQATTAWTNGAGEEFAGLSEAARCDLVFAVAALED